MIPEFLNNRRSRMHRHPVCSDHLEVRCCGDLGQALQQKPLMLIPRLSHTQSVAFYTTHKNHGNYCMVIRHYICRSFRIRERRRCFALYDKQNIYNYSSYVLAAQQLQHKMILM
jgi:hypothetical protein